MKKVVAIQGIKGSNHHKAAKEYFSQEIDIDECLSFDKLADHLLQKYATEGIMAIENSIAGSIIPNYALIDHNNFHVVGEHYLNIHHNLMVLPGQSIEDIKEVASHPMALLQCKQFLKQYPHIRLIEDLDTAETAKRIHDQKLKGVAAIAPDMAASMYDLEILAHNIQTIKDNSTRFVLIQTQNSVIPQQDINKASLKFITEHKRGSLATVLNVMSDCKLNLTKIQSLPVIEKPWQYSFFVDVTFEKYEHFAKAKSILSLMAEGFKILGEYKSGKK